MAKRIEGGSSPHKENLYKSHFVITKKHKTKNIERMCNKLNKIAKKRKYECHYKIQERNCDSGKCKCVIKIKNK